MSKSLLKFLLLATCVQADTLLLDFNSGGSATQTDWQSISSTWSGTYGDISVNVNATGVAILDHRVRTNNGGGGEANMWRDFLFANDATANGGFDIVITGLAANTNYPITLWSYDQGSAGTLRASDWTANDSGGAFVTKGTNGFNNGGTPQTLADYALIFNITTNGSGAITLRGVNSPTGTNSSHNVFLNGLRIGDPSNDSIDSDNDNLTDTWEIFHFGNITTATGSGNNDGDTLTNDQEETLGTNPTLSDSDSDGLLDHEEEAPGTNPLVTDTDMDGINDGDELSNTNGFITDPLAADSDGDSFLDLDEINGGTDPTDGSDFPSGLPLRISEFLANNFDDLTDGFDKNEDWIEIFNPNGVAIDLSNYSLTDDMTQPLKWSFPAISIPANSYLIVFASGNNLTSDANGNPHTNFKLSNTGEYLALTKSGVIEDQFSPTFPEQFADISYGRAVGILRFFDTTTPGAENGSGFQEVVLDTSFSNDRGFYETPFTVEITTLTSGATIRYTTNGSKPSATTGTVYSGPINVSATTTIRAIATKPNALSTNVDTHTYIFVDDIAQQNSTPSGWPTNWNSPSFPSRVSDYEMDQRVVNDDLGNAAHTIQDSLKDIPTLSLVLPQNDFTGSSGIYTNPTTRGLVWEKECSLELVNPDGTPGFQENCQVEMHGNSSRNPGRMQKHSMRITFKKEFGVGRLKFPLIEGSDIDRFNKIVLRACFTDSWGLTSWSEGRYRPNDSQYLRDVWMKESIRDMGQPSSAGTFMHLYVNGIYWGLYNPTERIEADMLAENYGGKEEDWEVNEDLTGKDARYNTMESLATNAGTPAGYAAVQPYIDVTNFADYCFLHFYGDSEDWPNKNGYAAANINSLTGDLKYRFYVWDQEIALDKFTWNRFNDIRNVGGLFQKFRANEEFRLLFADRVAKHMFNGGALTLNNAKTRYENLAARIDKAIMAESARWGDTPLKTPGGNNVDQPTPLTNLDSDAYPPVFPGSTQTNIYFTRENSWLIEKENILNHHMPIINSLTDSRGIIPKLRANNLYPSIDPPVFSQHGGSIGNGTSITMAGTHPIYFTRDGSDPRLVGGNINGNAESYDPEVPMIELVGEAPGGTLTSFIPSDNSLGMTWTTSGFDDSSWTPGDTNALGVGYDNSTGYDSVIDQDVTAMRNNNGSIYIRHEFNLTSTDFDTITLAMQYDDGFVAYLNGVEIAAINKPTPLNYDSTSDGSHEATAGSYDPVASITLAAHSAFLQLGTNVLAIHGMNITTGSSDFLIVPQLTATSTAFGAPPIAINNSQTLKARTYDSESGEWSALTEATFSGNDLVISEFMYHPTDPSGDAEFIEIMNTGIQSVQLEGLVLDVAIDPFIFPAFELAAGARALIVKNTAAFESVYGMGLSSQIIGEWTGGFKNSTETIRLRTEAGTVIHEFTYYDGEARVDIPNWPAPADGDGYSLTLIDPLANPDHNEVSSWRISSKINGTPGTGDTVLFSSFAADPTSDNDDDGFTALEEFVFGGSATVADGNLETQLQGSSFTFRRRVGASQLTYFVEYSDDLEDWDDGGTVLTSTTAVAEGIVIESYQIPARMGQIFVRVRATFTP